MNDGGPAYPRPCAAAQGVTEMWNDSEKGMSLRDYFAAETLSAMLVCKDLTDMQDAVRAAYAFADAMLRERERFYKSNPVTK